VIVTHKSKSLRSMLIPKQAIEDGNKKLTVYSIQCEKCQESYIGSTIKKLKERWREHTQGSGSVAKHLTACKSAMNVKVG